MRSGADGKTFLLGVGCQKGGTSWLHDYLSQSSRADFGPIKEYHVFDALDIKDEAKRDAKLSKLKDKLDRKSTAEREMTSRSQVRYYSRLDIENYYDFFVKLLVPENVLLTGDITPAYSGLSADRYQAIKAGFASRGVAVKVIFLMRDPVERIWSSVRMKLREKQAAGGTPKLANVSDEALLLKMYKQPAVQFRTNYNMTIGALDQSFASEDVYYGFYETLFNMESTKAICDFLGIPYIEPEFDKAVNTSPKTSEISGEVARRVAQAYSGVYRFVADRFGADLIDSIWPHAKYARP